MTRYFFFSQKMCPSIDKNDEKGKDKDDNKDHNNDITNGSQGPPFWIFLPKLNRSKL